MSRFSEVFTAGADVLMDSFGVTAKLLLNDADPKDVTVIASPIRSEERETDGGRKLTRIRSIRLRPADFDPPRGDAVFEINGERWVVRMIESASDGLVSLECVAVAWASRHRRDYHGRT